MNTTPVMNAFAALDLEPVKTKLMHVASGEGWSRAKVDALDVEYRRFLYLSHAFPSEEIAPTVDVDTFWHYHILDTAKYAADCASTFGYFVHHNPNVKLDSAPEAGDEERGGRRMREMYEHTFGVAYGVAEAAATEGDDIDVQRRAANQTAYSVRAASSALAAQGDSIDTQWRAASQTAYSVRAASGAPAARGDGIDTQRRAASQTAYSVRAASSAPAARGDGIDTQRLAASQAA